MTGTARRVRTATLAAMVGALTALLTGCSTSVSASDVSSQIVTQLKGQGVPIDNDVVTCPQDLPAEVGATMTCDFTGGGTPAVAMVKVTAVDGDNVKFDIESKAK